MKYLVIGGGAFGTLLATQLQLHGVEVAIIEKSPERRARLQEPVRVNGYRRASPTTLQVSGWDDYDQSPDALLMCVAPQDLAAVIEAAAQRFASSPLLISFVSGIDQLDRLQEWNGETIFAVSNLEVRLDSEGNAETGFHNFTWLGNLEATETDAMRTVQRDLAWLSPTLTTKVIAGMVWSKTIYLLEAALPTLTHSQPKDFYSDAHHLAIAADLVREGLAVAAAQQVTPIAFDFFDPNLYHASTTGERKTLEAWMRHAWERHEQYRVGSPAVFSEPAGIGWSLDPKNPAEQLSTLLTELMTAARTSGVTTPLLTALAELCRQQDVTVEKFRQFLGEKVSA